MLPPGRYQVLRHRCERATSVTGVFSQSQCHVQKKKYEKGKMALRHARKS